MGARFARVLDWKLSGSVYWLLFFIDMNERKVAKAGVSNV